MVQFTDSPPDGADIVIVGAGFSGVMSLVHLARLAPGARIAMVEPAVRSGPGVAYGACHPIHLLNVPADRMGACADDPRGFHRWLEAREPGRYRPGEFVSRSLYGEYLVETLRQALEHGRIHATFVRDSVDGIRSTPGSMRVDLASGRAIRAGAVVLAVGLPPARLPWMTSGALADSCRCVVSPWQAGCFDRVGPLDPVVVVGTGLTALDVFLSLEARGHRGGITFVSRSGRLPLPHAVPDPAAPRVELDVAACRHGVRQAVRTVRQLCEARLAAGWAWQDVIDSLRPHAPAIWGSWVPEERARFVRRVRPVWEIHRHRAPAEILRRVECGLAAGRLDVMSGVVERVGLTESDSEDPLAVTIRRKGGARVTRSASWIVNCIGPATRVEDMTAPLIQSLLASGAATTDGQSLGLRADADGRVVRADGRIDERLLVLGALRRGDLWESTAVPELRVQAAAVARAIAALTARGE